jgi:hypothetical protein
MSPVLIGLRQPWDTDGNSYVGALLVAGKLAGALRPKPLWTHYTGALIASHTAWQYSKMSGEWLNSISVQSGSSSFSAGQCLTKAPRLRGDAKGKTDSGNRLTILKPRSRRKAWQSENLAREEQPICRPTKKRFVS